MRIGIDLDDIVIDTLPSFVDFHNKRYGTSVRREDITNYHVWEVGIGRDKPEAVKLFDEFYDSPEFDKIPLVESARECILELVQLSNGQLPIVTSRPLRYRTKTLSSITGNFPEIPWCVYYSNDFHEGTNNIKADICQRLAFDFYVEDCLAYAESCAQRRIKVLLLDKPWNQNGKLPAGITRVYNWQEILQRIKGGSNAPFP